MTAPERQPQSPTSHDRIWQLMLAHIAGVPERFREAQINQAWTTSFMRHIPLGFDEDTSRELTADGMLENDVAFINLCLASLGGRVVLSVNRSTTSAARPYATPMAEPVAAFSRYDSEQDRWRVELRSGGVANLNTDLVPQVIALRKHE